MTTREPVRLVGTDADVLAVAERAQRVVARERELRRRLTNGVSGLQRGRQRYLLAAPGPAPTSHPGGGSAPSAASRLVQVVWSIALGAGLLGAVVGIAAMGPRKRSYVGNIDLDVTMTAVGVVVALLGLGIALALGWMTEIRGAYLGLVLCITVGVFIVLVMAYRVAAGAGGEPVLGSGRGQSYESALVACWYAGVAVVLIQLVLLAIVLRRSVRRADAARPVGWRGDADHRRQGRELRAFATRLASETTASYEALPDLVEAWEDELARLSGVAPETIAQARLLGPCAWLVWLGYDGGVGASPMIP